MLLYTPPGAVAATLNTPAYTVSGPEASVANAKTAVPCNPELTLDHVAP
jgi:hypothetical protein